MIIFFWSPKCVVILVLYLENLDTQFTLFCILLIILIHLSRKYFIQCYSLLLTFLCFSANELRLICNSISDLTTLPNPDSSHLRYVDTYQSSFIRTLMIKMVETKFTTELCTKYLMIIH